jgi:hypothetical protein
MNIQNQMNNEQPTQGASNKKFTTLASLVLFGGALIAAPFVRRHRAAIEHATMQATTRGRAWFERVKDFFSRASRA